MQQIVRGRESGRLISERNWDVQRNDPHFPSQVIAPAESAPRSGGDPQTLPNGRARMWPTTEIRVRWSSSAHGSSPRVARPCSARVSRRVRRGSPDPAETPDRRSPLRSRSIRRNEHGKTTLSRVQRSLFCGLPRFWSLRQGRAFSIFRHGSSPADDWSEAEPGSAEDQTRPCRRLQNRGTQRHYFHGLKNFTNERLHPVFPFLDLLARSQSHNAVA